MATHINISKSNLIIFMRQLALIMDSDISLYEGLAMIADKTAEPTVKQISSNMMETVSEGASLFDAMEAEGNVFPRFVQNMIKLGEETGEIGSTLEQIADSYEKEMETSAKTHSAIAYPLILTLLMIAVIMLLVVRILPMFNEILMSVGGDVPKATKNVMAISLWLKANSLPLLAVIAVIIAAIFFYKRSASGKRYFDKLAFSMPIFKDIFSAMAAVHFSRNLALLTRSGISTGRGMNLIADTFDNQYIAEKIAKAADEVEGGLTSDEAIAKIDIFPSVLIRLFALANQTGHMESMLNKAAETMEKELDLRLERLTTVIEPILIIILSIIVGAILISVILPIIDIMNAIG